MSDDGDLDVEHMLAMEHEMEVERRMAQQEPPDDIQYNQPGESRGAASSSSAPAAVMGNTESTTTATTTTTTTTATAVATAAAAAAAAQPAAAAVAVQVDQRTVQSLAADHQAALINETSAKTASAEALSA